MSDAMAVLVIAANARYTQENDFKFSEREAQMLPSIIGQAFKDCGNWLYLSSITISKWNDQIYCSEIMTDIPF